MNESWKVWFAENLVRGNTEDYLANILSLIHI